MADFLVSHIYLVFIGVLIGVPALLGFFPVAAGYGFRAYWKTAAISFVIMVVALLGFMVWGMYTMPLNVH